MIGSSCYIPTPDRNLAYAEIFFSFGIPVKNGQVVSLSIKMTKRDQESDCHRNVFAFSSPFCREDFLFNLLLWIYTL